MTESFDPYQKWLGISPRHQPPHHYRLLGLELFESDPDTIDNAASRQMAHVRTYQTGKHLESCQRILNDISTARICLLNPEQKSAYDAELKAKLANESGVLQAKPAPARPSEAKAAPVPTAVPIAAPIPVANPLPAERPVGKKVADPGPGTHADRSSKARHAAASGKTTPAWLLPAAIGGGAGLLCLLIFAAVFIFSGRQRADEGNPDTLAQATDPQDAPPVQGQDTAVEQADSDTAMPGDQESVRPVDPPERVTPADPPERVYLVDPPKEPSTFPEFGGIVSPPPADVPGVANDDDMADNLATLDMTCPCAIGTLRVEAPVMLTQPAVFTQVPAELENFQYTLWPSQVTDLTCLVRRPGTFYMLIRAKDTDRFRDSLPPSACERTSLECWTGPPTRRGSRTNVPLQQYWVYRLVLPNAGRLEINAPPAASRPLFVSKVMIRTNTTPLPETDELASRGNQDDSNPGEAGIGGTGADTADSSAAGETPSTGNGATTPPADRLPIPSSSDQAPLVRQVRDIYELGKLETPQDQSRVAKSLIAEGKKVTDRPEEQFVMFRLGCEVAAEAGDLETALTGVDEIGQHFEADTVAMRLKMAEQAAKARVPPSIKMTIIQRALSIIDEAMASDHLEQADRLADSLQGTVRILKDKDLMTALAKRRSMLTIALNAYRRVSGARETLKTKPDDPDANTDVGRYLCCVRGRWNKGLPMLAKGSDEELKKLAQEDLSQPSEAVAQWQVAEGWYGLSDGEPDHIAATIQLRAQHWYEKSLPGLTGIRKAGTKKRLDEIKETVSEVAIESVPTMKWPARATILADADYRYELYINGESFASGYGYTSSPLTPVSVMLNKGDTIIVRAGRSSSYGRAFACVIGFPGTTRIISTGAANSGWQSYQPESTSSSYWYRPGQGKVVGPVLPSIGKAAQRIMATARIPCGNIWGSYDSSRTSSYGYCYLILQIQ